MTHMHEISCLLETVNVSVSESHTLSSNLRNRNIVSLAQDCPGVLRSGSLPLPLLQDRPHTLRIILSSTSIFISVYFLPSGL